MIRITSIQSRNVTLWLLNSRSICFIKNLFKGQTSADLVGYHPWHAEAIPGNLDKFQESHRIEFLHVRIIMDARMEQLDYFCEGFGL